ncbi:MAG TPA: hypothetical protein PKC55_10500 [Dysgonomonas sp.]|uniref:hypothetical protein n=1 Tax=unclassified Dysgonomonas TaxID=2630389 RepID=UPI0025BBE45E|nr:MULTISPECIES: hypothetical protein [unclassified Dysgonomonas]HML65250.1 hypothetical protein [Dysgonomonas sp.]
MFLIYIILGVSVVLHLFRYYPDKPVLAVKAILFSVLCITEIYYLFTTENYNWFLDYNQIGIWKTIGGFILLTLVLLNQYGVFRILLDELKPGEQTINYNIGLYSYTLAVIGIIVCSFFLDTKYINYIVYFLFAAQLVQVILIFYQSRPHWRAALSSACIYLLGTITFIIVLYHYAGPFAIAAILTAAFYFILSVARARLNQRDY